MSIFDDLYGQLFGRSAVQNGNVIDLSEHGRVGGVSTGQPFKYVAPIDPTSGDVLQSGNGSIVDGVSAAIKATVFDYTNSNPVATAIVDASGNQVTSFGGGTQYTEGDTDATLTGNILLWEDTGDTARPVSTAKPLPVVQTGTHSVRPDSYATDDTAMPATPLVFPVGAEYRSSATTYADGDATVLQSDVNGNLKVTLGTTIAGEDTTNNRMMVEHQYQYSRKTADGQVKGSAGFLHTVTFSATGTVTSGVITVYDNTAESGTVIWSGVIQTGLNPTTIVLDVVCGTGIYVGYDGTIANVATTVSYR